MLRPLLCVLLLLIPLTASAQNPQWRLLPDAPLSEVGSRHDDIFFLDEFTGWVCNLRGEIWKTTNGGATWVNQVSQPEAFRSIAFLDESHGFAGSLFNVNLLWETMDGGENWSVVQNIPEPRPNGMCGLWPVGDQTLWGVGRYSGSPTVLKTNDAGATWESIDLSHLADTLVDCYFVSPDSGFVVGGVGTFINQTKGLVLSTGDGGATWQVRWQGTQLQEWGWKISFPTPLVGYVSLESNTSVNRFLKSTDGGVTWVVNFFGNGASFREQGIGFATADLGWLGGGTGTARMTTNGGANWAPTAWGNDLNRVVMIREDLGFAVGRGVYKYSVGETGTSSPPAPASRVVLTQNQPNPFNPSTVIPFYIDEESHVRIVVYDPRGRHMATLLDELKPFGEHEVEWDGRDRFGDQLPSGIYYYRLEAGEFAEVRKMTLLK